MTTDAKGVPKIADAALADREWQTATKAEYVPHAHRPPVDLSALDAAVDGADVTPAPASIVPSLATARLRHETAKAERAELELAHRRGELIEKATIAEAWQDQISKAKTRLMAIPAKARQRIPGLDSVGAATLEALIREALEELADGR